MEAMSGTSAAMSAAVVEGKQQKKIFILSRHLNHIGPDQGWLVLSARRETGYHSAPHGNGDGERSRRCSACPIRWTISRLARGRPGDHAAPGPGGAVS